MEKTVLRSVIVEDEQKSLDLLTDLIESTGLSVVIGSTTNPETAVDLITRQKPDIVFLDVKMPGKSGFEILDDLSARLSTNPVIIFTTAYDEFAVKAFQYAAFDYLLKPIDPDRLLATLMRCNLNRQNGTLQNSAILNGVLKKLIYRNISGIVIIDPSEVIYVEAAGNYSCFKMSDGRQETVTISIGRVEEQLPSEVFFITGRTYIINLTYLKKINSKKRECVLHSSGHDFRCDISHDKIKILLDRLNNN
jgi:two-component system LytT family response regulator